MTQRAFQTFVVGENVFQFEVMVFGPDQRDLQPLVILHSIEFPVPPSVEFCEFMLKNAIQVIFVRRAGYGKSSRLPTALFTDQAIKDGATAAAEAAMLRQLLTRMELENVILLAMGSANPVLYRLIQMAPEIELSILANPVFNQDVWQVFKPPWFQKMLKQIVISRGGLHVAAQGLKLMIRRDPVSFYKHIMQGHPDDMAYVDANRADYDEAGRFSLTTDATLLYYDAMMNLLPDPLLKDQYFRSLHAVVLIGAHSTPYWQKEMEKETQRLGLPIIRAPQGDLFCAYASPETVLDVIDQYAVMPASVYG